MVDLLIILIKKIINQKKIKKDKINIKKRNNIKININFIIAYIIELLIILDLNNQTESKDIIFKDSKIYLKIKGKGENTILGNMTGFNFERINHLKYVFINEKQQNSIEYKYYFNKTDNFVELIFDDDIDNCAKMFANCINITEINLSNFGTSQVKNMYGMFANCSSLTSLDLSNFDTSQVTYMSGIFKYCSSLTSLDLSNFNISQVTFMQEMFYQCINLEYINLYRFKGNENIHCGGIFFGVPENVVLCIENNIGGEILEQISKIKCPTLTCSNDWKLSQK